MTSGSRPKCSCKSSLYSHMMRDRFKNLTYSYVQISQTKGCGYLIIFISFLLIISGAIIFFIEKKKMINDPSLKIGLVKQIDNLEKGYKLYVSYSPNNDENYIEKIMILKHKPTDSTVYIQVREDGTITLYRKCIKYLCIPLILFVLALFLAICGC